MRSANVCSPFEALRVATRRLAAAGCDTPRLDAELLLAHALGVDRSRLLIEDQPVPAEFDALLERRVAREPVAYIVGWKEFRRLRLAVDRRVLIPRPETELLVEAGLTLPSGAHVADVGTGSGAVALALKDERPDLRLTGLDSSDQALAVARTNAERLELDVRFVQADLLDDAHYDAVLANLPYVPAGTDLQPEIGEYEPAEALFAGTDGLAVIRRLLERDLPPLVALEVAPGQVATVVDLLGRSSEILRDLAGHERVVVGRL
jgi:release factor glutamine methyltransferase